MKIIETRPRELGFVLWGHCQNLLDDPRTHNNSLNGNNNLYAYHSSLYGISGKNYIMNS